jgi:predicted nucleic acid-binding protein
VIIFDSNYLIAFLRPDAANPPRDAEDEPVEHFQERIRELINELNAKDVLVGVPTPVIAEILVRYPDNKAEYLEVLRNRYRFEIVPFGIKAAIEASELIAMLVAETKQPGETWAKVKFDIQIVATAKAEEAVTMLYADDKGVVNNAKRLGIPVTRIYELPLPTFRPAPVPTEDDLGQKLLFKQRENNDSATTTEAPDSGTTEENHQLEADPTHPAPIQGSDGGRVESEAPRETGKEGPKEVTARPCECGCGGFPKDPNSRFLPGHDLRKAYNDQKQTPP